MVYFTVRCLPGACIPISCKSTKIGRKGTFLSVWLAAMGEVLEDVDISNEPREKGESLAAKTGTAVGKRSENQLGIRGATSKLANGRFLY